MKQMFAFIVALVMALVGLMAQSLEETREEVLLKQLAAVQRNFAQTLENYARCESSGSQAEQLRRAAAENEAAAAKSLAARKLTLDKDGKVVPLPEAKADPK